MSNNGSGSNGNGDSIKISKAWIAMLSIVVVVCLFIMGNGLTLFRDHEVRIRHNEEARVELRAIKSEITRLSAQMDRMEDKIDDLKREERRQ